MSAQHTPGPWTADWNSGSHGYTIAGDHIAIGTAFSLLGAGDVGSAAFCARAWRGLPRGRGGTAYPRRHRQGGRAGPVTDKPEWADADLPDAPEDEDLPSPRVLVFLAVVIVVALGIAGYIAVKWT
jgi:hypothetical protein